MRESKLYNIYAVFCLLTLFAHIYNSAMIVGVKLFYIPAIITFILSVYLFHKKINIKIVILSIITLLSAFISSNSQSVFAALSMIVVMIAFLGLKYIRIGLIIRIGSVLSTIVLCSLLYEYYSTKQYRFVGYYIDPNYLVISLIALLLINMLSNRASKDKLLSVLSKINIFSIVVLSLLTLSRTGVFCVLLIIVFFFFQEIKKHFFKFSILIFSISFFFYFNYYDNYSEVLENFSGRLSMSNSNDNLGSAMSLRSKLSFSGIEFIFDNLEYFLFGIGISNTANSINDIGFVNEYGLRDHNTFTSVFSEQGLLGLVFFIALLYDALMSIKRKSSLKLLSLVVFISLCIESASIWCMTYLPFWWIFMLVQNNFEKEK